MLMAKRGGWGQTERNPYRPPAANQSGAPRVVVGGCDLFCRCRAGVCSSMYVSMCMCVCVCCRGLLSCNVHSLFLSQRELSVCRSVCGFHASLCAGLWPSNSQFTHNSLVCVHVHIQGGGPLWAMCCPTQDVLCLTRV